MYVSQTLNLLSTFHFISWWTGRKLVCLTKIHKATNTQMHPAILAKFWTENFGTKVTKVQREQTFWSPIDADTFVGERNMQHYRLSETNSQCRRAWSGRRLCEYVSSGIKLTKTVNHRMKTFLNLFFFCFSFCYLCFCCCSWSQSKQTKNFHKQTTILKMLFYAVLNLVPLPTFGPCRSGSSICVLFGSSWHPAQQTIMRCRFGSCLPAYPTTSGCLSICVLYVDGRGSMRLAFGVKAVARAASAAIVRCGSRCLLLSLERLLAFPTGPVASECHTKRCRCHL